LRVFQIPVGPMQNFAYLVLEERSMEALAIDSGWEIQPITRVTQGEGMKVKYVCATHGHFDHVETMEALASELGAATVAFDGSELRPQIGVRDGSSLRLGERVVEVIHTPGHTEDSVCYYDGAHLFTGDTLFIGAWGRTDLPGGSSEKLFSSLHDVIMRLPESTVVYPGHDYGEVPFRSIGDEAKKNPALLAGSIGEFLRLTQD
jgi:hydroxyacylglutathione hydrolase